ncbi:MAG TPA: cytochrome c3 family protein [Coriobacteriia bacterium]|nr:cytochrome c3 family protein [Coriobacteriia bacterium]
MPKRRLLTIVAGVVAAVMVLIVLPSYLATRPSFFSRYPNLKAKYVPWSTSTHVEGGCEGCHVPPRVIPRTAYRLRMAGEFYLSFVMRNRQPDIFPVPTNEACLACHSDLRSVSPKGDLRIPHRAHVNILKMKCIQCHNFLVHEKSPEGKHTPPMRGCLKCHNGDTAKNGCTACHTNKAAPATHQAPDWLIVHPERAKSTDCNSCHKWTDDWCVDCHARRPKSHTKDWRAQHGATIKVHRSCEACHEKPFCIRCHGEFPVENLNPALSLVK